MCKRGGIRDNNKNNKSFKHMLKCRNKHFTSLKLIHLKAKNSKKEQSVIIIPNQPGIKPVPRPKAIKLIVCG